MHRTFGNVVQEMISFQLKSDVDGFFSPFIYPTRVSE